MASNSLYALREPHILCLFFAQFPSLSFCFNIFSCVFSIRFVWLVVYMHLHYAMNANTKKTTEIIIQKVEDAWQMDVKQNDNKYKNGLKWKLLIHIQIYIAIEINWTLYAIPFHCHIKHFDEETKFIHRAYFTHKHCSNASICQSITQSNA